MSAQVMQKAESKIPGFKPGDTLRVHLKVAEGESERIQIFEGIVIRRRGRGISETFTVRKISFGVGVERTFPIQSPRLHKIELVRGGRARRARLYYLRNLTGKAARLSEDVRKESEEKGPAPEEAKAGEKTIKAEAAPASSLVS